MFVVHPHFHRRRTGVTSHVEAIVRATPHCAALEGAMFGRVLDKTLPRVGWRQTLRRARTDTIVWHAHRNVEMFVGLLLRLFAGRTRLVFTRHASHSPSWMTRVVMKRADAVVTLTPQMARTVGLPSHVVPHGVNLEAFTPPASRDTAWETLGVGGRFGVGVVGRIRPAKGQGDFVEAVAPLLASHPEWTAALVGEVLSPEREWVAALQQQAGGKLALPGHRTDTPRWYQGLSVLVQPSHAEGFGLSLLEGLASGCCVVATEIPGSAAFIDDGRTGFLYPPGDANALRQILARLMRHPEEAHAVGRAAARQAREKHGVRLESQRLVALYQRLLGGLTE